MFSQIDSWDCRGPKRIQKIEIFDVVFMHHSRDKRRRHNKLILNGMHDQ